jgi:hypothetical protein
MIVMMLIKYARSPGESYKSICICKIEQVSRAVVTRELRGTSKGKHSYEAARRKRKTNNSPPVSEHIKLHKSIQGSSSGVAIHTQLRPP